MSKAKVPVPVILIKGVPETYERPAKELRFKNEDIVLAPMAKEVPVMAVPEIAPLEKLPVEVKFPEPRFNPAKVGIEVVVKPATAAWFNVDHKGAVFTPPEAK